MDARPFRPIRAVPSLNNENWAPVIKQQQTLHQRHKSTGNLVNMPANGTLRAAAKRTALADFSNTSKDLVAQGGVSTAGGKGKSTAVMPIKENSKEAASTKPAVLQPQGQQHKAAFVRPAQRPSSKFTVSVNSGWPSVRSLQPSENSKATTSKKGPVVYSDAQIAENTEKQSQSLEDLATTRDVDVSQETVLQPAEAVLDHERPVSQQPETDTYDYLSRQEHVSDLPRESDSAESLASQDRLGLDCQRLESDATEAPYLDAVEELSPAEEISIASVEVGLESVLPPAHILSSDYQTSTKAEVKTVEFDTKEPALVEEIPELSDYEDEDYYDQEGYTTAHSIRSRGDTTTSGIVIGPPRVSKRDIAELNAAKEIVENNRTIEEIEDESWDISMVAEYGDEIFAYAHELEMSMLPSAYYMDIQTEIQWSMRSVLMDWVVQVHARFSLLPETLFLTANYIDRFLSCKVISLGKLQLVGATAILIAAKYEEINCPSISEIVYMVDSGYTADEIIKAERFMLSMLNFELGWPGPMSFLRRISKADDYDLETRTLSKYFLEVALMDERFVSSPPSYVAAGAHCLARLILRKGDWSKAHVHYAGYTFNQLKPLVGLMLDCCRAARKHHTAVYEKYSDKRYKRAATYVETELEKGFTLSFQRRIDYTNSFNLAQGETGPVASQHAQLTTHTDN